MLATVDAQQIGCVRLPIESFLVLNARSSAELALCAANVA